MSRCRSWHSVQCCGNGIARRDEIRHDASIDEQLTLVFTLIAQLVTSVEYTPHLWTETECVRQDLKDYIPIRGAIPRATQCRETERVRGIVGEVEAAFERVRLALGVGETDPARSDEARQLRNVRGFRAKGKRSILTWCSAAV